MLWLLQDNDIVPREVQYIDYQSGVLGNDTFDLFTYKRSEFAFERDLRFFLGLHDDEVEGMEIISRIY